MEKVKIDELRKWRDNRVCEQQYNYDRIIGSTLDANEEARREVEANFRHNQRKQELDMIAAQRGRTALRKELANEKRPGPAVARKPKSRSTEVQTDDVAFARPMDENMRIQVPAEEPAYSLAPESAKCDAIISDRSVDILEKSKQFVADANRRLDEISAKVANCQSKEQFQDRQQIDVPSETVTETVTQKAVANKAAVRTNHTHRLRCEMQRKPAPPPKVVNRPKKVIPSAKETESAAPPSRGSVVCYDHPNRFTKTYDIPKNIVVKNDLAQQGTEDDAVTNALNETLTQFEEDNYKETRSKELRKKEAIRELEAIEKSQVRRDYEMLAKTLDEVRKNRNASPSAAAGYQFVSGNDSCDRMAERKHKVPLSDAINDVLHLPIRISCPKVPQSKQGHLNVGDSASKEDYSGSDSAQSILLDQLISTKDRESHQVKSLTADRAQVVVENNVPNVKVRAVTNPEGQEPMKIIIQVESIGGNNKETLRIPASGKLTLRSQCQLNSNALFFPAVPMKVALYGSVNESLSTNYMSPPSEIATQMDKFLKPKPKAIKPAKKPVKASANLKSYITKLLEMPQSDVDKLSENDVSDLPTPSNSILNVRSNVDENKIYDEQKMTSVSRIIEDNYSILEEVNELIAQNSGSGKVSTKETAPSTDSIMQRYATMSQTYNDRIHSLNKMIKIIRAEKQSLMHDNGLSNVTTSERDTSTKYKDFGSVARTITPSGSELSNDSGEILSGSHQIKKTPKPTKSVQLGANRVIVLSRDSGISMSRPVTSTEVRDAAEDRGFEPMLKDIPRQKPLDSMVPATGDVEKKRPPNSITRYTPEAVQVVGHDLSTIIEVDTPATVHVAGHESLPGELKKFPTIEEFVTQNGNNVTVLSEMDTAEVVVPMKPFVSFNRFVDTNRPADGTDVELNLSEIADELRRRSLLNADGTLGEGEDDDGKKYIRSLSRELEDMIQRIHSQAPKEPNGSLASAGSFKSIVSDHEAANDTTLGQCLDKIQLNKFPTREEFNLHNNSKHYNSAEILKSFLNGSTGDNERRSPQKQRSSYIPSAVPVTCQPSQAQSSGSSSSKKPSDSLKSQTLNLSDDLMNALENNLNEMGLKWAVNMLKRSHLQVSSSTSRASSSENVSKDALPFESKTMSLLTDLEKSSISDESKTSNIKNIILKELIRTNQSGNSSSDGSLSCSNLGRRLLNATGSDDGRGLRTSTPVNSNIFTSMSTSTLVDRGEKTVTAADNTDCLFSNESRLSSVKEDVATLSNFRLNVPDIRLNLDRFSKANDSSLSTEYPLNEHNKRKMSRRLDK